MTEAVEAREEAISRVGLNNTVFVKIMVDTIREVAKQKATFIAADLWEAYKGKGPEPTDVRAMGAAIRKATKMGIIAHSGVWTYSGRRSDHNDRVPIWNSNIHVRY